MIDETLLSDPTRCPDCAATLTPARDVCPGCALPLAGPLAGRLWQVAVQAAETLQPRAGLLAALRAQRSRTAPVSSTTTAFSAVPAVPGVPPVPQEAGRAPVGAVPPRPRQEWSARRIQNLLLALGVGLLGVAAVIFVAVSWQHLGV